MRHHMTIVARNVARDDERTGISGPHIEIWPVRHIERLGLWREDPWRERAPSDPNHPDYNDLSRFRLWADEPPNSMGAWLTLQLVRGPSGTAHGEEGRVTELPVGLGLGTIPTSNDLYREAEPFGRREPVISRAPGPFWADLLVRDWAIVDIRMAIRSEGA